MEDQFHVHSRESVDFKKNALTSTFSKMQNKCFMDLGKAFPVSNFLKAVTSRHCSNDSI